uniref:Glycosyltransferase family 14 family protein n=1 Tax=Rhizophora mucronata TaxID=61149 RepID=A0A2P2KKI5_RHIMU
MDLVCVLHCHHASRIPSRPSPALSTRNFKKGQGGPIWRSSLELALLPFVWRPITISLRRPSALTMVAASATGGVPLPPLDLTEDNVRQVLADARVEASELSSLLSSSHTHTQAKG